MKTTPNIVEFFTTKLNDFLRIYEINDPGVFIPTILYYKTTYDLENRHHKIETFHQEKIPHQEVKSSYIENIIKCLEFKFNDRILNHVLDVLHKESADLYWNIDIFLSYFNFNEGSITQKDLGLLFSKTILLSSKSRRNDNFVTSTILSEFLCSFIILKSGDTVYDPFGGSANLITTLARQNQVRSKFFLEDININQVYLGTLNLLVSSVKEFYYNLGNSFLSNTLENEPEKKYDYIISDPPFGMSTIQLQNEAIIYLKFRGGKAIENFVIQLALEKLLPDGKAIIIVPERFCFANDFVSRKLREFLVVNDLIEYVISLPTGIYNAYPGIKTSVLIINKQKQKHKKKMVCFVEISDKYSFKEFYGYYKEEITNNEKNIYEGIKNRNNDNIRSWGSFSGSSGILIKFQDMARNNFALNSNKYIYSNLDNIPDVGENTVLKDVIKKASIGVKLTKDKLNYLTGIPYIMVKDLNDSDEELTLTFKDGLTFCHEADIENLKLKDKIVPNKSILVALVGAKLKPTYVSSTTKIIASDNLLVIEVDENRITPEYLISQMKERYFVNQLNRIRKGTGQLYINKGDLLNLVISLPHLQEQNYRVKNFYNKLLESAKKRIGYKEEEKKEQEKTLLSTLRHEYLNRKKPLEGINLLKKYLDKKINSGTKIRWDDLITGSKTSATLLEKINDFESAIDSLNKIFIDIPQIFKFDIALLKTKKIGIKEFINSQINILNDQLNDLNIKHKIIGRNLWVSIDPDHFSYVIQNLILNSVKHAFDPDQKFRLVAFEISLADDKQSIFLDYKDNGKGFPDGFTFPDFIEFAKKSGESAGSGIGGYLINSIVINHGGSLAMISDTELLGTYKTFLESIYRIMNFKFLSYEISNVDM